MKTFIVELWANQDLGHIATVTLPEEVTVDPNNKNTLCVLSRLLMKYTNGSRVPDSAYQQRPISNGDVIRVENRRFCILLGHSKTKETMEYHVLELSKAL